MPVTPYINEGGDRPPRLAVYLNLGTLTDLPAFSQGPRGEQAEVLAAVKEAGFEGVQGTDPRAAQDAGLSCAAGGRVSTPDDLAGFDEAVRRNRDEGCVATTIHLGWGMESDAEIDRLVAGVVEISIKHEHPVFVETHRATATQDTRRTVDALERHPGLKLNGDYSHWYTGLEMPYAGVETVCDFLAPAFGRVGFMHGRIGNSSCMQVDIGDTLEDALRRDYVQHFRELWTRTMAGFLRHAGAGDVLVFAPELLQPAINYARVFPGHDGELVEECDRWRQALLYAELVRQCFDDAQQRVGG